MFRISDFIYSHMDYKLIGFTPRASRSGLMKVVCTGNLDEKGVGKYFNKTLHHCSIVLGMVEEQVRIRW